jgi:hypothetical protein
MAAPKLDIFRVLNAANNKDANFFRNLTEEEQKAFMPFLIARWMSGTTDARQIYFINELMNSFTFSLQQHKELLWYLITICNSGKPQRYTWNKLPAKSTPSRPTSAKAVMEFFGYSTRDANEALLVLTRDEVLDMAEDLAFQPDEIAKIKKEFKGSGDDAPPKKRSTSDKPQHDDLLEF